MSLLCVEEEEAGGGGVVIVEDSAGVMTDGSGRKGTCDKMRSKVKTNKKGDNGAAATAAPPRELTK